MHFRTVLASLLINVGATAAFAQPVPPAATAAKAGIVPLVDYHVHINSLMYAQTSFPPILPRVQLPPELAPLLSEFGKNWRSQSGLAPLLTQDSMLVKRDMKNWVRGIDVASGVWSKTYGEEITLIPVNYQTDNSTGYIMAYLGDTDPEPTIWGQALIALKKEKDGQWRIAGKMISEGYPRAQKPVTAEDFLAELDAAGIQRANILSIAFVFAGSPELMAGEAVRVRAENDFNAQQAARHPSRLTAFCSLNPLKDYALAEVERCGRDPRIKGLKFHFSDSGIILTNARHLAKMKAVFKAANKHRLAVTAHTATIFLNDLLPLVPDVPVQIAHMTGDSGFGEQSQAAFGVFAAAIEAKDPRTKNLYFDGSGPVNVTGSQSSESLATVAAAMRRVGLNRILFASDRHSPNNFPPAETWKAWMEKLPLTEAEFRDIADNIVRYR
jgi:predicted TIM-barrel fold metal-dependent hydrolase